MFIYLITNKINQKKYIGATTRNDVKQRWREHISQAKRGSKNYFHMALQKHGKENFIFEILEEIDLLQTLNEMEIFYIKLFNTQNRENGYNLYAGGDLRTGYNLSEEHKKKIGEFHKGNTYNLGRILSEEHKKKISESHKGENNNFYGKYHSEETKLKLSKSMSGRKLSKEHIQKITLSSTGRMHSEESKIKMSESKKGKKRPKHVSDILRLVNSKPIIQMTRTGKFLKEFDSMKEIVDLKIISYTALIIALKHHDGGIGEAKGYIWRYKSDFIPERLEQIKQESTIN